MAPSGEMMIEWVAKNARVQLFDLGFAGEMVVEVVKEVVLGRRMF